MIEVNEVMNRESKRHPAPRGPLSATWRPLSLLLAAALATTGLAAAAAPPDDPPAALADNSPVARAAEVSEAFKAVAAAASPSVARISGYTGGGAKVTGSGFVIDPRGYLLTNNHVVESAVSLVAEFSGGRIIPATLVGTDPLTDLAVIRIAAQDVPALRFAESSRVEVGEWVVAIGFPLGLDQTVTIGVISATNRQLNIVGTSVGRKGYEDFIQTDAAINRGNSGGPLLNLRGEVVGVNAAIVTQTGGSDGLGFAIPTNLASYIAGELIARGRVVRAWLGIGLQDLTPALAASYGLDRSQHGALLTSVNPDEPAGRAGLLPEDVLVSIDEHPVLNVEDLRNQVAMMQPGRKVLVELYRDGRRRTAEVVLAEMSSPSTLSRPVIDPSWGGRLGVRLEDLNEADLRSLGEMTGVLVAQVAPGRPGQLNGLNEGDIIVEVNGEPLRATRASYNRVSSAKWLFDFIEQATPGTILRLTLQRRVFDAAGRFAGYGRAFTAIEFQ